MIQKAILKGVSVLVVCTLLAVVMPAAQEGQETLPVRFSGTIIATGNLVKGMNRVTITADKWSSDEDDRIGVKSLPNSTGPQKITNIEQVKVKVRVKKKKKKKKSE